MKKIITFLFFIISILNFSCRIIKNPNNIYTIKNNKVYYKAGLKENGSFSEIKGADYKSFITISYSQESCEYRDYGKDNKSVYFKDSKIDGADPKTFTILEQGYYKDKRYVYFSGKRLEGSDSRKEITIIKDNKDTKCIPWGDGGCILNNSFKYLNGEKLQSE